MVYGVSVDFDCISNSDDSCELIDSNESCDSSDTGYFQEFNDSGEYGDIWYFYLFL